MQPTLLLRAALAVLVLPGTIAVAIPWMLVRASGATLVNPVGVIPAAVGAAVLLWCVREFYAAGRGTLAPWDPPRALVSSGLYRLTRNPMYVGVLLVLCGWAVVFASWFLAAYAVAVGVMFHLRVVRHEEPFLAAAHPDAWCHYAARVPRWLL